MPGVELTNTNLCKMGLFSECCCAATASGVATVIANPFEVAKTRLQLQGANAASAVRYRGSVHAVVAMLRHEGLAGAYRGFGAFAGYRVAMNGTRLGLYWPVKQRLRARFPADRHRLAVDVAAASCTGAVGACAGNPFQVIKTQCMMHGGGGGGGGGSGGTPLGF